MPRLGLVIPSDLTFAAWLSASDTVTSPVRAAQRDVTRQPAARPANNTTCVEHHHHLTPCCPQSVHVQSAESQLIDGNGPKLSNAELVVAAFLWMHAVTEQRTCGERSLQRDLCLPDWLELCRAHSTVKLGALWVFCSQQLTIHIQTTAPQRRCKTAASTVGDLSFDDS